jgi:lysophospholipase L1-like esterase
MSGTGGALLGASGGAGTANGGATAGGGSSGGSTDGKTPIKVWMAGDSTMDNGNCTGCGDTACGWGSQVGALFNSSVTVDNKGKSGASTQTWLYGDANVSTNKDANGECIVTTTNYDPRWTAMLDPNTGMKKGDYLIIEFGINDDGTLCNRRVGPTLFQKYLTYMAQEAKNRGAQAILLTSTAALICTGSTANTDTRNFGPQARAAGAAVNAPVIDMTVLTAQMYTSLGLCPNNADYTSTTSKVGQFFCNDHTHFEKAGAAQIAQVFATALKSQKIGLASYLLN